MGFDVNKLQKEVKSLKDENKKLKETLEKSQEGFTLKVDADALMKSLQADLLSVDDFAMKQERATTYVVSDFNLQLKAVITKSGEKYSIALPSKPGEIDPNLMSVVNLSLKPVPLVKELEKKPRSAENVETIEGIGPETAQSLGRLGIKTVSDLALSSEKDLKAAKISEKKAKEFTGMARLIVKSGFSGIAGVDEQAAELLVCGAKIDSRKKLAEAKPEELFSKLKRAIEKRLVKVPKGYAFDLDDVKRWVESAKAKTR